MVGVFQAGEGVVAPNRRRAPSASDRAWRRVHQNATVTITVVPTTSRVSPTMDETRLISRHSGSPLMTNHSRMSTSTGNVVRNKLSTTLTSLACHGKRVQRSVGRRSESGHHNPHHSGGHDAIRASSSGPSPCRPMFQTCSTSPVSYTHLRAHETPEHL